MHRARKTRFSESSTSPHPSKDGVRQRHVAPVTKYNYKDVDLDTDDDDDEEFGCQIFTLNKSQI